MALEDFVEPEVGIAVAVTAAMTSPKVRGALRRGAVYGLAGLLKAGDAVSTVARGVRRGTQEAVASATPEPSASADAVVVPVVVVETPVENGTETHADAPHRRPRKASEAANGE